MAGLPEISVPEMTCCLGLEDSIEAYVGHLLLIFRELWRVLTFDGTVWLNLGDSYAGAGPRSGKNGKGNENGQGKKHTTPSFSIGLKPKDLMGIPWRIALVLQADGWYLRSDIIWHKANPMPESVTDRPTKSHEYIFLLSKSKKYWYDADAIREAVDLEYLKKRSGGSIERTEGNGLGTIERSLPTGKSRTLGVNPLGRNARTVWTIATKPFPGAHFAVFPPALVEKCLLAGCPSRVCVECGEPWVRVVEKGEEILHHGINNPYQKEAKGKHGTTSIFRTGKTNNTKTLGIFPSCQCCPLPAVYIDKFGDHWPRYEVYKPGVVLDPFFGSGTTGVVAEQLGRKWIGIDLNPEYVEMAKQRLIKTQPVLPGIY